MRVVHCKKEPFDVYIGRPGPWGNPFGHKEDTLAELRVSSREEAITRFERYIRGLLVEDREYMIERYFKPLAGKVLGCWCHPKPCHGEVLIKICKELGLV